MIVKAYLNFETKILTNNKNGMIFEGMKQVSMANKEPEACNINIRIYKRINDNKYERA